MPGYTNIPKPTGASYSSVNPEGRYVWDDAGIFWDDSGVYWDGNTPATYTLVAKPTSSVYTLVAKPT